MIKFNSWEVEFEVHFPVMNRSNRKNWTFKAESCLEDFLKIPDQIWKAEKFYRHMMYRMNM